MGKVYLIFEGNGGGHGPDLLRGIYTSLDLAKIDFDKLVKADAETDRPNYYEIVEWEINKLNGDTQFILSNLS